MAYADEVIADSPWLYWKLDDSGATADDASGNGRTGTYTGSPAQSQAALINTGSSVLFDGTGTEYCLSTAAIFNNSTATIEVWFDYDGNAASAGAYYGIATCAEGNASGTGEKSLLIDDADHFVFYVYDGAPQFIVGSTAQGPGTYHIVGVIDDAANTAYLYVNGTQDGTGSATSSFSEYTVANVLVGGEGSFIDSAYPDPKTGRRDEFALYTTALSAARVLAHYQAASAVMQTICPDADITTTGWTTTPLWSKIGTPADATIITSTAA